MSAIHDHHETGPSGERERSGRPRHPGHRAIGCWTSRGFNRQLAQVQDGPGGQEKVHPENPTDVEAIVHPADLDLEAIEEHPAEREVVDSAGEDHLVTADSAEAT